VVSDFLELTLFVLARDYDVFFEKYNKTVIETLQADGFINVSVRAKTHARVPLPPPLPPLKCLTTPSLLSQNPPAVHQHTKAHCLQGVPKLPRHRSLDLRCARHKLMK